MVAEVVYNYSQANIPLETMWTDIDYMDLRRTWTLDPERFPLHKMQELVTYLHDHHQQYILMVDPPVSINDTASYDKAKEQGLFMKWENGTDFVATMWPGAVSFIDFFHPDSQDYWSGQIGSFFHEQYGVAVDGMWIDMNDVCILFYSISTAADLHGYSPRISAHTHAQTLFSQPSMAIRRQRLHHCGPAGSLCPGSRTTSSRHRPRVD